MKQNLIFWITVIAMAACGPPADDIDSFIQKDVDRYNAMIAQWEEQGKSWIDDPILITQRFFLSNEPERKTVIEVERETENKITVTYTREGLKDDSVDGEKRIFEFERIDGSWRVQSVRLGFKCWESRGHTNYSGEFCS